MMNASPEQRVLVLAPVGRDAAVASEVLGRFGLSTRICPDIETLCSELAMVTGVVLLTEEALTPRAAGCLIEALAEQPAWSDLPLVVLTSGGGSTEKSRRLLDWLGPRAN